MEEISDVAVLIAHSSPASAVPSGPLDAGDCSQSYARPSVAEEASQRLQQKRAADSLIQVIEKLSKIVEKRPQRRCTVAGQKRVTQAGSGRPLTGAEVTGASQGASPSKKPKRRCKEEENLGDIQLETLPSSLMDDNNNKNTTTTVAGSIPKAPDCSSASSPGRRTVTCYQCSLCWFLSPTLALLKEHLRQHDEQHSDLILMCSECRFTSRHQGELEAHVRLHFDEGSPAENHPAATDLRSLGDEKGEGDGLTEVDEAVKSEGDHNSGGDSEGRLPKKKWYSYEEYGLYRCLICSYVCSQQRMLKTHAWKHAGLVDCSYPIFEDEAEAPARKEAQVSRMQTLPASLTVTAKEELVVLSPALQEKGLHKIPPGFKVQLCTAVENRSDLMNRSISGHDGISTTAAEEEDMEGTYQVKDHLTTEEPAVELQVTTETEMEIDSHHGSGSLTDSLLTSAQKIINSSPNSAGHINVIVERLPSAGDPVIAANPLLLSPDVSKRLLDPNEEEVYPMEPTPQQQHQQPVVSEVKEELVIGWSGSSDSKPLELDLKPTITTNSESPCNESIPPAARRRTHSESLRLHSLAAEALVAMPMRTPALPTSSVSSCGPSTEAGLTMPGALAPSPGAGQNIAEVGRSPEWGTHSSAAVVELDLRSPAGEEEGTLGLGLGEAEEEGPVTKAGISLSLLTVIERLRERSDQNTSDEDILKELQDNAQFQNSSVAAVSSAVGVDNTVCAPDGGLVDYFPGSERPYRCRLCLYSSGNKGYIKQHLRVHRQRQPYQCPICEHIATDSKDLESHMIHHCKTRMYQCKQCPDTFHYKGQLRSHEREQHNSHSAAAFTALPECLAAGDEAERGTDEESGVPKVYKCDVCNYTSATYVGVRNHRRIHNSDKPYRCCSCDFATTNMNSLKSHMRRHPQEHQAVHLLEQYRCSLCGYMCSHPPSLKSHMWKHAGDQNYNYEQVNRAINEAISQSGRTPQKPPAVDPVLAPPPMAPPPQDPGARGVVPVETTPLSVTDGSVVSLPAIDLCQWSHGSPSPPGKDLHLPPTAEGPAADPRAPVGPSMEYCMLLFCCCICGFESTSKERLMEHMKEHEGDIISIILSKEPQHAALPAGGNAAQ